MSGEQFNHLNFILREWSGQTILCLVRGEHPNREHGFLIRRAPVIELGYVDNGGTGEQKQYESFEAMLADGWLVD